MLKKTITFESFDGDTVAEDHYFNLSAVEVVEMSQLRGGDYADYLTRTVRSKNGAAIMEVFRDLIQRSYGRRTEDGKRFVKDPEYFQEFTESPAFEELFVTLVTDAAQASEFFNGVMPKKAVSRIAAAMDDEEASAQPATQDLPEDLRKRLTDPKGQVTPADLDVVLGRLRDQS
jgi:hypothetical protein